MTLTSPGDYRRPFSIIRFFGGPLLLLCLASGTVTGQTIDLEFKFRHGDLGWTADFASYFLGTNNAGIYELDSGIRYAPRKLTYVPIRAFYLQGHSRSASLQMFLKKRLTASDGIVPGRTYRLEYTMKLASQAASGCIGIGSPPGEGVFLRAGGSAIEPVPVFQPNGGVSLNIDLATATTAAGNIANGLDCEIAYPRFPYLYIGRSAVHSAGVTATPQGELWLYVGTQSGFEGLTRLYYQEIRVRLVPVRLVGR